MKQLSTLLLLCCFFTTLAMGQTSQPLYLDLAFQKCGKVQAAILSGSDDDVTSAIRLPNNKILLVGTTISSFPSKYIGISRHLANGDLDPTFGTGGKTSARFDVYNTANGVAVQPDGKILVTGLQGDPAGSSQIPAISRYFADGKVDTVFGTKGSNSFRFDAVAGGELLQAYPLGNGKILALGLSRSNINGGVNGVGATRFTKDGDLDASFGTGGVVQVPATNFLGKTVSFGGGADSLYYVLQKIYNGTNYDLTVVRFTKNGLDKSFNGTGSKVFLAAQLGWSATIDEFLAATRQPDGKILVLCSADRQNWYVSRVLANGTLDNSFGTGGNAVINTQTKFGIQGFPKGIDVLTSGKILLLGGFDIGFGIGGAIQLTTAGAVDATYGSQGYQKLDLNFNSGTHQAVGYLPDGTGHLFYGSVPGDGADFTLARFVPTLPKPVMAISKDSLCVGDSALLTFSASSCARSVQWLKNGLNFSTDLSIKVASAGVYRVIADYIIGTDTSTPKTIWASTITKPTISQNKGLLTCSVTAPAYQWFKDNVAIPNSNRKTLLATSVGTYTVRVTEKRCKFLSTGVQVTILGNKQLNSDTQISAFWNRADQSIHIKSQDAVWQAQLISVDGKQLTLSKTAEGNWQPNSQLTRGIYWLKLISTAGVQTVALPIDLN